MEQMQEMFENKFQQIQKKNKVMFQQAVEEHLNSSYQMSVTDPSQ
jgi:hypothetical protein